ncbi:GtrA family protein [Glaciimonas sp. Gout2]|uniref:GtrA family protein n=2 Tax=Glaciimonas TaxID=1229970 RepID=UPI002B22E164|nr:MULTISPECIES: GtrA family protein [unclassified Glaciimonas]MEB0013425.1 GtrA family protein [Glaciimonas sp. Cout2]MEB0082664.1 GtrA family protein [Glaciimonas sp. Gout2]
MTAASWERHRPLLNGFLKFAVIGGLGTLTNLLLFFLLVDCLRGPALPIAVLCYILASTQNYILNHYWTFKRDVGPSIRLWQMYLVGSLGGLVVNILILRITLSWFPMIVYSQLLGIGAGLIVNFFMVKVFVFKNEHSANLHKDTDLSPNSIFFNLINFKTIRNYFFNLQKEDKKYFILAWIVMCFGVFLRFYHLDKVGLWSDELFTVAAALDVGHGSSWLNFTPKVIPELNFNDSFITWKAADNTPPLFDLLVILWAKCFGSSDFVLRSLSAFLGALSPFIFFYGLKKNVGYLSAFLGVTLLALSPSAIIYSQEVRSYTLTLLLCTIATVRVTNHILQASNFPTDKKWTSSIWVDVAIYVLMAYSHYTGLFMAGLFAGIYTLFVIFPSRRYFEITKFLIVPLAIFPWMLLSKKAFIFSSHGGYAWGEYHLSQIITQMIPGTLNFLLPGYGVGFSVVWAVFLMTCLTGYSEKQNWIFSLKHIRERIFDKKIILAILLIATILFLFLYSVYNAFTSKMWHPRYFLVALPVIYCSFSLLFSASKLKELLSIILTIIISILSLIGIFNYFYKDNSYKEEYREGADFIANNIKDDSVILLNWPANEAYYRHYLDKLLPKTGLKYTYKPVANYDDVKKICASDQKKGRSFFVFQHQDQTPLFQELDRCSGMVKIAGQKFRGVLVYEYVVK